MSMNMSPSKQQNGKRKTANFGMRLFTGMDRNERNYRNGLP